MFVLKSGVCEGQRWVGHRVMDTHPLCDVSVLDVETKTESSGHVIYRGTNGVGLHRKRRE